jgi:hypothetical protein
MYVPYYRDANVYLMPQGRTVAGVAVSANVLYQCPIFVHKTRTFTTIAIQVTSAIAGNARLGLYTCLEDGGPGNLIRDCGVVTTGSTGVRSITGLSILLTAGRYWLAAVYDAAPSVQGRASVNNTGVGSVFSGTTVAMGTAISRAFTYAGLPSNESAQTYTVISGATGPAVGIR